MGRDPKMGMEGPKERKKPVLGAKICFFSVLLPPAETRTLPILTYGMVDKYG